MKKKIWIFLALLVVVTGGICLWDYFKGDLVNEEYVSAKTDGYDTLEEMEAASECIVRVKKESEGESTVQMDGELITYGCTISDVKIQEVFYNTLGEEIQKDKVIKIWENEFQQGNTIYHIAGYEKMKVGEEYILFLRKSTSHDCFLSLGVVFGKVPVQEEQISTFARNHQEEMNPIVKTIAVQAREKYVK